MSYLKGKVLSWISLLSSSSSYSLLCSLKDYQNINGFFAIVMGLGNSAVTRLTSTWERLPSKSRKVFAEFEALIEPSRNHRAYRMTINKLSPPVIPFMPLLLKDMTFTHEGNKTWTDGLVNFEKMHMFASTMRVLRHCRSRNFGKNLIPSISHAITLLTYMRG